MVRGCTAFDFPNLFLVRAAGRLAARGGDPTAHDGGLCPTDALVDEAYPEVEVVRVVLDNLNTHRMASLYEAFPAAEARRIAKRLEFHYTPKHGSWLNMAENWRFNTHDARTKLHRLYPFDSKHD